MRKLLLLSVYMVFSVSSVAGQSGVDEESVSTAADSIGYRSESADSTLGDSGATADVRDTIPLTPAAMDTTDRSAGSKSSIVQPTPDNSGKTTAPKINLTKRTYHYKQQVIIAVGMMVFVTLIMTTAQSWNPK